MTPEADCCILFGAKPETAEPHEFLMQEQHILVGSPSFQGIDLQELLLTKQKLHVLDGRRRLDLWPNWLNKSNITDVDIEGGFEFSTLDQAIHAVRQGVGLAVVDMNMISEELFSGAIVRLSDIEMLGPFGYWMKVGDQVKAARHCLAFQQWLRDMMVSSMRSPAF